MDKKAVLFIRLLVTLTCAFFIVGWLAAPLFEYQLLKNELTSYYHPDKYQLSRINTKQWLLKDCQQETLGFVGVGEGSGYNGPIRVLVQISTQREIIDITILDHNETPTYFEKLDQEDYLGYLATLPSCHWDAGMLPVVVSGATISSEAVAGGVREILTTPIDQTVRMKFTDPVRIAIILLSCLFLFFLWRIPAGQM